MRSPKYALEPLAQVRESKADEAVRELAGAVAARTAAELERTRAEQARHAHAHAAGRARAGENEALARGELTAADLARADAWEVRVAAERASHEASLAKARDAETRAHQDEGRARSELVSRRADAKVVANDRARWSEAQRRRAEAREEEAAAEACRPKR